MSGIETYLELASALRGRADLPELARQREYMLVLANHLEWLADQRLTKKPATASMLRGLRSWFKSSTA